MLVKFWGVRGSIPHSISSVAWVSHIEKIMKDFLTSGFKNADEVSHYLKSKTVLEIGGFGTATTCVQLSQGSEAIIIDGGSGIKSLSDEWVKRSADRAESDFHILLTHFHFDHIMGLPFFLPHFKKGCRIHYYSPHPEMESVVRSLFQKPMFPVEFSSIGADVQFHLIKAYEPVTINGFMATAYKTDHPDLNYGYKIQRAGKTYAHAVDNEGLRRTKSELGLDAGLYEGADLLYFDAQYDEAGILEKKGWGHGTGNRGFEVCAHFNIQQVLLAHHDPAFSIEDSLRQKKKTEKVYQDKFGHLNLKWDYAYEGLTLEL